MGEIYKPKRQIAEPYVSPDGKSVAFIEGLMSDEGLTVSSDVPRNALLGEQWKQKSSWLSRCVRFVIAKHSPERVFEKGLPMEAPEKNRCNRSEATQGPIFSGPIC